MQEVRAEIALPSASSTYKLGFALGVLADSQLLVTLAGPLGAGKTSFVKALASGLGITQLIGSPTFTMLNEYYSGRLPLFHFDLYRLAEQAYEPDGRLAVESRLGFLVGQLEEFLEGDCLVAIEWPEHIRDYLPVERLEICLQYAGSRGRRCSLRGAGTTQVKLIAKLSEAGPNLWVY